MAQLRFREVGRYVVPCGACAQTAVLTVTESRYARGLRHRLDPRFDAQVTRTATCAACASTYPIRATDDSPSNAARREDAAPPRQPSRTRPCPPTATGTTPAAPDRAEPSRLA